ncbi:MAG: hypothetical protein Q9160_006759 [Pyrenula sp. 1 TL-2023]
MFPQYQEPRWRSGDVVRVDSEGLEDFINAAVDEALFETSTSLDLPSTESSFDVIRHIRGSRTGDMGFEVRSWASEMNELEMMRNAPTLIEDNVPAGIALGRVRPHWAAETDSMGTMYEGPAQLDDDIPTLTNIGLQRALVPPPLPPRAPNHRFPSTLSQQPPSRPGRHYIPSPQPLEETFSPPTWWENHLKSPSRRIRRTRAPARIETSRRPNSHPKPVWAEHFTASPEPYDSSNLPTPYGRDGQGESGNDSPWNPPGLNFSRGSTHLTGPLSLTSMDAPGAWSPPGHFFRAAGRGTVTPGPYSGNIIEVNRSELRVRNVATPPASRPESIPRPRTAGKGESRKRQHSSSSDAQAPTPPPQPARCAGGCGHAFMQGQSLASGNGKKREIVCSDCDPANTAFREGHEAAKQEEKKEHVPSRVSSKKRRRAPLASAKVKAGCVIL